MAKVLDKANNLEAEYQMFGMIKEIGLAYDPSITVPTDFRTLQENRRTSSPCSWACTP